MAKGLVCANVNTPHYQALNGRVGVAMAQLIWNATNGNIGTNGLPLRGSVSKLSQNMINVLNESRVNEAIAQSGQFTATDRTLRRDLFGDKSVASIGEVMEGMWKRSPEIRPVISALRKIMSRGNAEVIIRLSPTNLIPRVNSDEFTSSHEAYYPATGTIEVAEFGDYSSSRAGLADNKILHGIVHAIVHDQIEYNPNSQSTKDLEAIYNHVISEIAKASGITTEEAKQNSYGLSSVHEFVSEAFTNPVFIKQISKVRPASLKIKGTSVLDQFVMWVSDLLGLNSETTYGQVMSAVENLVADRDDSVVDNASPEEKAKKFLRGFEYAGYGRYELRSRDQGDLSINEDVAAELGFDVTRQTYTDPRGNKEYSLSVSKKDIGSLGSESIVVPPMEDPFYIENDYMIKNSTGTIITSEEFDAAQGAIIRELNYYVSRGINTVGASSIFEGAHGNLLKRMVELAEILNSENPADKDGVAYTDAQLDELDRQYAGLENVTDGVAWDTITRVTAEKLASYGVHVKFANSSVSIAADEVTDDDVDTKDDVEVAGELGVLSASNWADEAMFSVSETGTSTRAVKTLMWSLRDPMTSSLGLPKVVDPEEAYRNVLGLVTATKAKGIAEIMNTIAAEGAAMRENGVPNNIYEQLHDMLTKASQQTRIQFAVGMSLHRNSFILNIFDRNNKLTTFDSNRNKADQVVLLEWKSIIRAKILQQQNGRILDALDHINEAIAAADHVQTKNSSKKEKAEAVPVVIGHIAEAFRTLGIPLNVNTLKELANDKTFSRSKRNSGFTFKGSGLLNQFSRTGKNAANGVFTALADAIDQASKAGTAAKIEDLLDDNSIRYLAKIESRYAKKYFSNMSSDVDGNHRYGYGIPTHMTRTEDRLLSDADFIKSIQSSTFSRFATWVAPDAFGATATGTTSNFMEPFRVVYRGGLKSALSKKKATLRKKMSLAEDVYARIINFANNGLDTMAIDDSTKSDKHVSPMFVLKRRTLTNKENALKIFNDKEDDSVVIRYGFQNDSSGLFRDAMAGVAAEADRMLAIRDLKAGTGEMTQDAKDKLGKFYADNGQFFYFYKFLNDFFKFDDNLDMDMGANVVINGKNYKTDVVLRNPELLEDIVASYFKDKIDADIAMLEQNKLIAYNKDGEMVKAPVPVKYAKDVLGIRIFSKVDEDTSATKINPKKLEEAMRLLLLEMNLNSQISLQNSVMIFSGDFANNENNVKWFIEGKRKQMKSLGIADDGARSIKLGIDAAMDEYQKRLASDIAPGVSPVRDLKVNGKYLKKTYGVIFTKDFTTDGEKYFKSIKDVLGKGFNTKALYGKGSDALEIVSLQHKLESMYRYGLISEPKFTEILEKYNRGEDLSVEDMRLIFVGAGKPVQVSTKFVDVNGRTYQKKVYIKSAETPLIRQITRGLATDYEDLRLALEDPKSGVDRIVHVSAAKMKTGREVDIYNKDGTIKSHEELKSIFTNSENVTNLDWGGFSYQQDLAPDMEDGLVPLSTQADKGVLAGVLDMEFEYHRSGVNSGKVKGDDLRLMKDQIEMELSAMNEDSLNGKLGVNPRTSTADRSKVLKFIKSTASKLKWRKNELMHSALILKSGLPVLFSPISPKIESLMFSQVTNSVIKSEKTGKALVQYELPFEKNKELGEADIEAIARSVRNGAVMVGKTENGGGYDPNTGLRYSMSEDGNVSFMQIVVPFNFFKDNRVIDLNEYKDEATGKIDLSRVDPKLLRIVGLRIPNQGHPSQILCEIVGFLPEYMGDICYVHPNIVVQMGSDFDIDKLYTYWRNGMLTNDGKIKSIPPDFVKFDGDNKIQIDYDGIDAWINENFDEGEKPELDDVVKKAINDAYFDIFNTILSHKDVIKRSMNPLDAPDLEELAAETFDPNGKGEFGDFMRQATDYNSQSGAKLGVGVFSKVMTSFTKMQNKGLFFALKSAGKESKKDVFRKFKDSDGNTLELFKLDPNAESTYISADGIKNKRTALKNIIIQQSGALDNAKKQVLFPNGIVPETYGVSVIISAMSDEHGRALDLSINARFLRQEGIVRLVQKIQSLKSITSTSEDARSAYINMAYKGIIDQYTYGQDGEAVKARVEEFKKDSYSSGELMTIDKMDHNSIDFKARQVDLILTLVELDKRALKFSKAIASIDTDSNGAKISYWENQAKLHAYATLDGIGIENVKRMHSEDGKATVERIDGEYEMSNIDNIDASGNNVRVLSGAQKYIGDLMGYTLDVIAKAQRSIEAIRGAKDTSFTSAVTELRKVSAAAFKSFIYSKTAIVSGYTLESIIKDGNLTNRLINMKQEAALASNYYVQSMRIASDNNHVYMDSRIKDGSMADDIIRGFNDLYYSKNQEHREFAIDMVRYEILAGANHNPTSTIKYIDAKVFSDLGVYDQISSVMSNEFAMEEFEHKFFVNNPDEAFSLWNYSNWKSKYRIVDDDKVEHFHFPTVVDEPVKGDNKKDNQILHDDILTKIVTDSSDGKKVYKKYIRVRMRSGTSALYRYNGIGKNTKGEDVIDYVSVPTMQLGRTTMDRVYSDYTQPFTHKVFSDMTIVHTISSELDSSGYPVTNGVMMSEEEAAAIVHELKIKIPHNTPISNLGDYLRGRGTQLDDFFSSVIENLPAHAKDVRIKWSDNTERRNAVAMFSDGNISIFESELFDAIRVAGSSYAHGVLMHEINHAITNVIYIDGSKSASNDSKHFHDSVNSIYDDVMSQIRDINIVDSTTGKTINPRNSKYKYGYVMDRLDGKSPKEKSAEIIKTANELHPGNTEKDALKRGQYIASVYFIKSPREFMAEMWNSRGLQQLSSGITISSETKELLIIDYEATATQTFFKMVADLFSRIAKIASNMNFSSKGELNALQATFMANSMVINIESAPSKHSKSETQKSPALMISIANQIKPLELGSTVVEHLRSLDKNGKFAFRKALENGLFKTKCN